MAKKQKTGKADRQGPFAVGNKVRVRPGVADPDFPDIPLGGWVGKVEDVAPHLSPPTVLVAWNRVTLKQMHPIFRHRCERDGLDEERMWLNEDELEPYDGSPVVVEQPTQIIPRPLNPDEREDRIRAVFGLTSDENLPLTDHDSFCEYHRYLAQRLVFPFPAAIRPYDGSPVSGDGFLILGLLPADDQDPVAGLVCEVRRERRPGDTIDECNRRFDVPLIAIAVAESSSNGQLIDDYTFWLDVFSV
jgi:hypothetical protein